MQKILSSIHRNVVLIERHARRELKPHMPVDVFDLDMYALGARVVEETGAGEAEIEAAFMAVLGPLAEQKSFRPVAEWREAIRAATV
jgi:hypothetical protein